MEKADEKSQLEKLEARVARLEEWAPSEGEPQERAGCMSFLPGKPGPGEGGVGGDLIFNAAQTGVPDEKAGRILFRDKKGGRVMVFDFEQMALRPLRDDERRPLDET